MAVPGITEIKAQQLMDYLGQSHEKPARTARQAALPKASPNAPAKPPVKPPAKAKVEVKPVIAPVVAPPDAAPQDDSISPATLESMQSLAAETSMTASSVLKSALANTLDEPLARQLGKLVSFTEYAAGLKKLGPKRCERAAASLRKIGETLQQIAAAEKLGGKQQRKLAEALRDNRRRLEEAVE
jgi:hypothetical protein